MAALPHGGRIVPIPILTSHEQHQQFLDSTTPSPAVLEDNCSRSTLDQTLLLDQLVDSEAMRRKKTLDLSCLEMPCLKERGLFALPTEGDGKLIVHIDLYNLLPFQASCSHPIQAISDASPRRQLSLLFSVRPTVRRFPSW